MLAVSWKNVGQRTWEFKLREGIIFSSGEPFNAEAAKWNIDWMRTSGKHAVAGGYNTIEKVNVVDEYTIHVVTKQSDPLLPKRFAGYGGGMTPPKYIQEVGRKQFGEKPIGTGAYIVKEWVKDDHVTFVRNENYWAKKGEFQEVVVKPAPDNMTRLNMLLAGEVDIVTNVLPDQIELIEKEKNCRIEKTLAALYGEYTFNCRKGPLQDVRVRQASNYAVDKKIILEKLWKGCGIPSAQGVTTFDFGYDPKLKPYPYDPEKARQLIKAAGYEPGQISYELLCTSSHKELTEFVCIQLNEVGIMAHPRIMEAGTRSQLIRAPELWEVPGGGFLLFPGCTIYDTDGILWRLHHPKGLLGGYWDGVNEGTPFYEMMEKARYSFDQDERKQIYHRANQIYRDKALALLLFQYDLIYGVSKRINFKPVESERIYFNRITLKN
jgi:peptide/nickel transport system substrate-binding protein